MTGKVYYNLRFNDKIIVKSFLDFKIESIIIVELKKEFKKVILTKPNASRQVSSEIYLICIDKL